MHIVENNNRMNEKKERERKKNWAVSYKIHRQFVLENRME